MAESNIKYVILGRRDGPLLLARVRWPDVCQAVSAGRPVWQEDVGLFDLPYDPNSSTVSIETADKIAVGWGAPAPSDCPPIAGGPVVIRRMPANWSHLSPAERETWALESLPKGDVGIAMFGASEGRKSLWSRLIRATLGRPVRGDDRRVHPRIHLGGRAQIRCGHRTISANLVDASPGGIGCVIAEAESILAAGARIDSPVLLENASTQLSVDVSATVTWRRQTGRGLYLGLAFDELDAHLSEEMQRMLADDSAGSGN